MSQAMKYLMSGIAILLAACTSPVIHYHTLLSASPAVAEKAPFAINVLAVTVPDQLDTPQVVIRDNSDGATILENERWLSPLADEFTKALSAQLAERLGTQDVSGLAYQTGRPVVRMIVKVRRFDSWPAKQVNLQADWSLMLKPANRQVVCSSHLSQPAAGDISSLFPAWQQALNRLSEQIAAAALTFSCPDQS